MKRFLSLLILSLAVLFSGTAYADIHDSAPPTPDQRVDKVKEELDARVAAAMKIANERLATMTKEEKEKLVSDLNHPDGTTLGQGMASFGKELGQGIGGAVKEVGTTFNEFANSGVGKIATMILVWHFFGRSILWFIFICMLLSGLSKMVRSIFGDYDEKGKFIRLNLKATNDMSDGVVFGVWIMIATTLMACIIGAAVNF